jgi:hypothetical protein
MIHKLLFGEAPDLMVEAQLQMKEGLHEDQAQ